MCYTFRNMTEHTSINIPDEGYFFKDGEMWYVREPSPLLSFLPSSGWGYATDANKDGVPEITATINVTDKDHFSSGRSSQQLKKGDRPYWIPETLNTIHIKATPNFLYDYRIWTVKGWLYTQTTEDLLDDLSIAIITNDEPDVETEIHIKDLDEINWIMGMEGYKASLRKTFPEIEAAYPGYRIAGADIIQGSIIISLDNETTQTITEVRVEYMNDTIVAYSKEYDAKKHITGNIVWEKKQSLSDTVTLPWKTVTELVGDQYRNLPTVAAAIGDQHWMTSDHILSILNTVQLPYTKDILKLKTESGN